MNLLPADPMRKSAVLLAFLALSGVYFVHTYLYKPRAEAVEAQRTRLGQLEDRNRRAEAGAAMGGHTLEERLALYEEHIGRLERLIPANEEVAVLLEAISEEERRAGVEMTMMRPEPLEPGEFYDRWSYQLGVRGSYHAVGSFMTAIASLERIVAPTDVVITLDGTSSGDGGADDGGVLASFRIQTYVATSKPTAVRARPPEETGGPET